MTKKILNNMSLLIYVILIGIVLFPMIYTVYYSLPAADDFSMALSAQGYGKDSLFLNSVCAANERFMNWTGLWPYMFIETLINPVIHFSLESGWNGIERVLLFSAFIGSICILINVASKKILDIRNKGSIALFILGFLFVFLNTSIYKEVFYWFVGSSYMMALTFGIITVSLTIEYFSGKMNWGGGIFTFIKWSIGLQFFSGSNYAGNRFYRVMVLE